MENMTMEIKANPMLKVYVEKITLNIGAGKDEDKLKRGIKLLKTITGSEPVKTMTQKRIPSWGLRPGLIVGCKFTMRGKKANELLKRLLEARDNKVKTSQFDENGNLSFGIAEYIDIPGVEYDPEIKIMGLEVAVTLSRPGYHISKRKVNPRKIPTSHRIQQNEAIQFMKEEFHVETIEEGGA
jgi:large subunit ribosomal protein L5